jgi:hypothetical protein
VVHRWLTRREDDRKFGDSSPDQVFALARAGHPLAELDAQRLVVHWTWRAKSRLDLVNAWFSTPMAGMFALLFLLSAVGLIGIGWVGLALLAIVVGNGGFLAYAQYRYRYLRSLYRAFAVNLSAVLAAHQAETAREMRIGQRPADRWLERRAIASPPVLALFAVYMVLSDRRGWAIAAGVLAVASTGHLLYQRSQPRPPLLLGRRGLTLVRYGVTVPWPTVEWVDIVGLEGRRSDDAAVRFTLRDVEQIPHRLPTRLRNHVTDSAALCVKVDAVDEFPDVVVGIARAYLAAVTTNEADPRPAHEPDNA